MCQFISVIDSAGNDESPAYPTFTGLASSYSGSQLKYYLP